MVTTDTSAEITFAARDYGSQLRRWGEILHQLKELKESRIIQSLDLSVSQNSPIRWNVPTSVLPPSDSPERGSRLKPKRIPRRSHV